MNIVFDIPCVILSGGKSQRMGEDKSLLSFGQFNSLIEFQYRRLKPYFKETFISSKNDKFKFLDDKSRLILDTNQEIHSPILALKTILETIKDEQLFLITVDTPFIKPDSISKIIKASKEFDICVAKTSRTHNLCGVFSKTCLHFINEMLKNDIHKINFLIQQTEYKYIEFLDENEFLNINTRNDYKKSLKIII